MSGDRLSDIEERLKVATPGPWRIVEGEDDIRYVYGGSYSPVADCEPGDVANPTLIAHAPDDLAYLLRVARAAERLQSASDAMQDHHCSGTCVYPREHDDVMRNFNEASDALRRALEGDADGK